MRIRISLLHSPPQDSTWVKISWTIVRNWRFTLLSNFHFFSGVPDPVSLEGIPFCRITTDSVPLPEVLKPYLQDHLWIKLLLSEYCQIFNISKIQASLIDLILVFLKTALAKIQIGLVNSWSTHLYPHHLCFSKDRKIEPVTLLCNQ